MINFFRIPNQSPLVFKNGINVVTDKVKLQQLIDFIKLLGDSRNLKRDDYLKIPVTRDEFYGFGWTIDKYHNFRYFVSENSEQLEFNDDVVARKEKGRLVGINFNSDISEKSENALLYTDEIDDKLFIPRALPWIFNFDNVEFKMGYLSSYSGTNLCQEQIDRIEILIKKVCVSSEESTSHQYLRSLFVKLTGAGEINTIIENDDPSQYPSSWEIRYKMLKDMLGESGYGLLPNFQIITFNSEWKYSVH